MKKLTMEEFRHRVIQAQRRRKHLTPKRAFIASLYQSESKSYQLASSVNYYR